jgi:hypothetical protein
MRRNWRFRALRFAIFGLAAVVICGWIVTGLWNVLMPEIVGARTIGFWQALGLLLLGRLLFGGFRGPHQRRRMMMRRWAGRWEKMTPEEREKFRQGMEQRCGGFRTPETDVRVQG